MFSRQHNFEILYPIYVLLTSKLKVSIPTNGAIKYNLMQMTANHTILLFKIHTLDTQWVPSLYQVVLITEYRRWAILPPFVRTLKYLTSIAISTQDIYLLYFVDIWYIPGVFQHTTVPLYTGTYWYGPISTNVVLATYLGGQSLPPGQRYNTGATIDNSSSTIDMGEFISSTPMESLLFHSVCQHLSSIQCILYPMQGVLNTLKPLLRHNLFRNDFPYKCQ